MDAQFTPDGNWIVFARNDDLYMTPSNPQPSSTPPEIRLTFSQNGTLPIHLLHVFYFFSTFLVNIFLYILAPIYLKSISPHNPFTTHSKLFQYSFYTPSILILHLLQIL